MLPEVVKDRFLKVRAWRCLLRLDGTNLWICANTADLPAAARRNVFNMDMDCEVISECLGEPDATPASTVL